MNNIKTRKHRKICEPPQEDIDIDENSKSLDCLN